MFSLHTGPAAHQMDHFQADPSSAIVISHHPFPTISSPSFRKDGLRAGTGSAPCFVTHLLVSNVAQNAHSIAWLMGMPSFHSSPHTPTAALPTPWFSHVWGIGTLNKAASLTGKPCCPGFPLSPSSPSCPLNKKSEREHVCVLLWQWERKRNVMWFKGQKKTHVCILLRQKWWSCG